MLCPHFNSSGVRVKWQTTGKGGGGGTKKEQEETRLRRTRKTKRNKFFSLFCDLGLLTQFFPAHSKKKRAGERKGKKGRGERREAEGRRERREKTRMRKKQRKRKEILEPLSFAD